MDLVHPSFGNAEDYTGKVFVALVARPSLCTYAHYGLGVDLIGDGVHLQLSANDWRQINHLIETPFTVSAPALSTVTSSHVDTQASLKDDAPEESASGLGSSTASNMLRNPFCFLVQVFVALVARPSLCTYAHYGLGADHIGDGVHLQLSVNDWRQINHLIETPFTVSAPALSTVTSSHVDTQASLKDDAPEESASGLGSSTASNMLRNPFCFLVQVFVALVARPSLGTYAHYGLGADHIGDGVHLQLSVNDWRQINHLIETPFTVSAPALSTVTSSHVDTQASLKDDAPEESASGLGSSTASNMLRNPFCFLVQVFVALVARPSLCTYAHYGLGADHIGDGVHLQLSVNDWRQINHLIETPFTVSAPALSTVTSSHVDTQASLKYDAPEESTVGSAAALQAICSETHYASWCRFSLLW
ncbi:uncharacterized protein LOC125941138 [Dermacentor silvarum]|uniref:uncharacterized protein LOC125941138 n=1 Tax=Dermacentor silvarum TaxID=543639 RepID=UPI00210074FE|nr:uncharacterized protein LOC125941138 [Dermacentor silvarum]